MSAELINGCAGSFGACLSSTCVYPIEVIKTRIQAGKTKGSTNFITVFLRIIKYEGVKTLYAGLSSQYLQTALANFIFFYFYSKFKKWAIHIKQKKVLIENNNEKQKKESLSIMVNMIIGIAAAVVQILLITPINVALTRIKTNSPPANINSNIITVILRILKNEGFNKLYAGITPSLILTINPGLEFTIIEYLRDIYEAKINERPTSMSTFIISALGKIGATTVTYPYILAKVKMQNSGETSLLGVIAKLVKNDGLLSLYTGFQIQLIKAVLFASLRNTFKERILQLIERNK